MPLELSTIDYLFNLHSYIEKNNDKIDKRLSSYYCWLLNNRCAEFQQNLAITPESLIDNIPNKKDLPELSEICTNCWSTMTSMRLIPKKYKRKKPMKKGNNFNYNIINCKCKYCETKFRFKGLNRSLSNVQVKQQKLKEKIRINQIEKSTKTSSRIEQTNHKLQLQKLLINSKKNKNLDNQTKLSKFLENCFD